MHNIRVTFGGFRRNLQTQTDHTCFLSMSLQEEILWKMHRRKYQNRPVRNKQCDSYNRFKNHINP